MVHAVRRVHASPAVRQYIVDLAAATRSTSALRLGISPRATLHLLRAGRAHAALRGRDHVLPDDIKTIAIPVPGPPGDPLWGVATLAARRLTFCPISSTARASPRNPLTVARRSGLLTQRGSAFLASGWCCSSPAWLSVNGT